MPIPGPLGGNPAPGNPPTPGAPTPQGSNTPAAQLGASNEQSYLQSLLGGQLNAIGSATGEQNTGLGQQLAIGGAEQGITNQSLSQQLQDTLAGLGFSGQSLGVQRSQIGQEEALEQGQYGIQQQQNALSGQGLADSFKNLQQQYGLQQQQFGLEGKQTTEGAVGSGVGSSNTLKQQMQGLGIQEGQAASNYQLGLEQNKLGQQQLGLTGKGEALSNTYQQQQIQDALKNLGISQGQLGLSGTEARQQYGTGTQQAANTYANLTNQIGMAQGANTSGEFSQVSQLLDSLFGAGMFTG